MTIQGPPTGERARLIRAGATAVVINSSGVIRANSLIERNGEIILDGGTAGTVVNSGALDAQAGAVTIRGNNVSLTDSSAISAASGSILVEAGTAGNGSDNIISSSQLDLPSPKL